MGLSAVSTSHWVLIACLVALTSSEHALYYYQVMTFVVVLMEGGVKV